MNPFDIFAPEARGNHVLYARMRVEDPVHRALDPQTGTPVWFLTRYDHCISVMRDKRFSKESRFRQPAASPEQRASTEIDDIINRHMLNLDGIDHARLKALVHKAFTPSRVDALRPRLQTIADSLLDAIDHDVTEGAEFDLTERYAEVFPLMAIMAMLGIPSADYAQFRVWTKTLLLLTDEDAVYNAIVEFSMYLHHQIDLRHADATTRDDLLTGLIFAEDAGDRLSRQELLAMVFLLFAAGYETVANFINNALQTLFEHPDQLQLLRDNLANPAVVSSAIEELLRYKGPSYMTLPSWAFEDVAIGGKVIAKGDRIHAVLHAANRDPLVFDQPDQFNILRHPNRHLGFSQGMHHCLGAPLARLEGQIAITTLLHRLPD